MREGIVAIGFEATAALELACAQAPASSGEQGLSGTDVDELREACQAAMGSAAALERMLPPRPTGVALHISKFALVGGAPAFSGGADGPLSFATDEAQHDFFAVAKTSAPDDEDKMTPEATREARPLLCTRSPAPLPPPTPSARTLVPAPVPLRRTTVSARCGM